MKSVWMKALLFLVVFSLLCGGVYTLAVTGIAQVLFPGKANGSIVEVDGVKYGSSLLAQQFTKDEYLWGRIMLVDTATFTDGEGSPVMYAWASNKTPAGEELEQLVAERAQRVLKANPDRAGEAVPQDLVTVSGSGLDPHISPAAAEYQVPRIAKARGIGEDEVRTVIDRYSEGRLLGIFGEPTVNVLKVNLALDGILKD